MQEKKICPNCGSKRAKGVPRERGPEASFLEMFIPDFECKDCGTHYEVKPNKMIRFIPLLIGIGVTLMGIAFIFDPDWDLTFFGYLGVIAGGPGMLAYGIYVLIKRDPLPGEEEDDASH